MHEQFLDFGLVTIFQRHIFKWFRLYLVVVFNAAMPTFSLQSMHFIIWTKIFNIVYYSFYTIAFILFFLFFKYSHL